MWALASKVKMGVAAVGIFTSGAARHIEQSAYLHAGPPVSGHAPTLRAADGHPDWAAVCAGGGCIGAVRRSMRVPQAIMATRDEFRSTSKGLVVQRCVDRPPVERASVGCPTPERHVIQRPRCAIEGPAALRDRPKVRELLGHLVWICCRQHRCQCGIAFRPNGYISVTRVHLGRLEWQQVDSVSICHISGSNSHMSTYCLSTIRFTSFRGTELKPGSASRLSPAPPEPFLSVADTIGQLGREDVVDTGSPLPPARENTGSVGS